MFDTMTMTKIVGGFCGTLLVFLLGNWAADSLYEVAEASGHGEGASYGYEIQVASAETAVEEVEEGPDFATLFASADIGNGESVFGKCKSCHKLEDGAKGVGPSLYQVVNRDIGSIDGYSYSGTLTELAGEWTPEALNGFLENPKGFAAGTKMSFRGLPNIEDRANLIAYLATIGG